MTPETLIPIVNQAAAASDRWMFMAMLIITGGGSWALIKWLIGSYTKLAERLASVIEANTDAMRQNAEAVEDMGHVIQGCNARNKQP